MAKHFFFGIVGMILGLRTLQVLQAHENVLHDTAYVYVFLAGCTLTVLGINSLAEGLVKLAKSLGEPRRR